LKSPRYDKSIEEKPDEGAERDIEVAANRTPQHKPDQSASTQTERRPEAIEPPAGAGYVVAMTFERISVDHRVMAGVPCIAGTRIPVATIVGLVARVRPSNKSSATIRSFKPTM